MHRWKERAHTKGDQGENSVTHRRHTVRGTMSLVFVQTYDGQETICIFFERRWTRLAKDVTKMLHRFHQYTETFSPERRAPAEPRRAMLAL